MPEVLFDFCRHDLLLLRPGCEFVSDEADRSCIEAWIALSRPVIVRRPCLNQDGVHCGIPLPPGQGKRRLSLIVGPDDVDRVVSLPSLESCVDQFPGLGRGHLNELAGLSPQVFGSLAWQKLTSLPYLHENSDLDLLFRVEHRNELGALIATLHSCDTAGCDIEIMLWNGDSFSWREFSDGCDTILMKCMRNVRMEHRKYLCGGVSLDCNVIASAALSALREELETYPKAGLVSFVDSGSHEDMNAQTFLSSISSLEEYFFKIASAGSAGVSMAELCDLGISAERNMMKATGGINTHRGAVFSLGLLAAAAGFAAAEGSTDPLGDIVHRRWGNDIMRYCGQDQNSHGALVRRKYGRGGARGEAARGFPAVYQYGLPAFRKALSEGAGRNAARVHAFFALLEQVEDSTILYRGGMDALDYAMSSAARFNRCGGVMNDSWRGSALEIHREFMARRLSCGGVADLLSAVIFIYDMEELCRLSR